MCSHSPVDACGDLNPFFDRLGAVWDLSILMREASVRSQEARGGDNTQQ